MSKNGVRSGSRQYHGKLFYNDGKFFVRFTDKANGKERDRVVEVRGMPRMEENIFHKYADELREGRDIRFNGHPEFDPDGVKDNEAIMFIEWFRFLKPRSEKSPGCD